MATEFAGRLRRQSLGPRVLTAVIGIPLMLGLLWLGAMWWLLLTAAIAVLGVMEFGPLRALTQRREVVLWIAALLAFAVVAEGSAAVAGWALALWAVVLVIAGLMPMIREGIGPQPAPPPPAASIILGIVYLATPFAMLYRWRLEFPPLSVVAFLIVIWANDIAAYFVGLAVGRHRMAPRVSPGKSWEGALGGLAGGVAAGLLVAGWLPLAPAAAAVWAVTVTIVSQAGDLFESALKRRAGVKDSGRLLPGHGGVLDRFDGILLAAPVALRLLHALTGR